MCGIIFIFLSKLH